MITSKESIGQIRGIFFFLKKKTYSKSSSSPICSFAAIPIPRPETKKERKKRCANGQINRVLIAIASFQTPGWLIGKDNWEKMLNGFTQMCVKNPSKEEGEKIERNNRR